MTVDGAGAVGLLQAVGAVALHHAGVALTLADAGDVHMVALCKGVHLHLVANVQVGGVLELELLEDLLGGHARLLQMAQFRLGELLLRHVLVTELHGFVAVFLRGLLLHHGAGARLDDGDRDHVAGLVEDLRHADLLADDGLFHLTSSLIKVIGRAS